LLVLATTACTTSTTQKFRLLANGAIQYVPTGRCLTPEGGTVTGVYQRVVLSTGCDAGTFPQLRYQVSTTGTITHVQMGFCLDIVDPRDLGITSGTLTDLLPRLSFVPCSDASTSTWRFV